MHAAIVNAAGQAPQYGEFPTPVAADGEQHVTVTASALSPLTRSRASGAHYSASGAYPLVAGVDGTGVLRDGRRVYFIFPRAPFGAMAEETVVPDAHCLVLPDDLDDVTAAALANPGMSSWAALTERARFKAGETVLVNGATGTSGQMAVQIARCMGAGRIIATGRNPQLLASLAAMGADVTIQLGDDPEALEAALKEQFAQRIDVVLDYLWGASAERILLAGAKAGPEGVPIRFVQIGTASGADVRLPGAVLRSSAIELLGSGIGSVAFERLLHAVDGVLNAAVAGNFSLATRTVPLARVAEHWADAGPERLVFTMNQVV